jgi:hypothetical protein
MSEIRAGIRILETVLQKVDQAGIFLPRMDFPSELELPVYFSGCIGLGSIDFFLDAEVKDL